MTKRRDCLAAALYTQAKGIFSPEKKAGPGILSSGFCIGIQTDSIGFAQEFQISDTVCRISCHFCCIHVCLCRIIGDYPETRVNLGALYRPVFFHPAKSIYNTKIRPDRNNKIMNHFGNMRMMY